MSREEATNVFNEGLIMDLNPLTTPDNVLTDCLNGTIITYNGNEFVLQNDQGNFRLRNCRLQENFIPVGIREYAGILYIISYNPLTTETEIGSYPSPQTIFEPNSRDNVVVLDPIIEPGVSYYDTYNNLVETAELQMYADSSDLNNYKLNPGDEYRLGVNQTLTFPYQEIKFSILTEDKELIDIDPESVPVDALDSAEFKHVSWEIPGWLVGKYSLARINQFYLNIMNLRLPEFLTGDRFDFTLNLNSQIETNDELFTEQDSSINDLKIEYSFWIKQEDGTLKKVNLDGSLENIPADYIDSETGNIKFTVKDSSGKDVPINNNGMSSLNGRVENVVKHNYNDLNTVYYNNVSLPFQNASNTDVLYISAVPVLVVGNVRIYYEQFRTELEINLNNIFNTLDIKIGETTWKWQTSDDMVTINFDINGPFSSNSQLSCSMDIIDTMGSTVIGNYNLPEVNFFGNNIVTIPIFNQLLKQEEIYLVALKFTETDENGVSTVIRKVYKPLITSILFNDYYYTVNRFDQLYANDWIGKYQERLKLDGVSVESNGTPTYGNVTNNISTAITTWPTTWFSNSTPKQPTPFEARKPFSLNYTINYGLDLLNQYGGLWQQVGSTGVTLTADAFGKEKYFNNVNVSGGTLNVNDAFTLTHAYNLTLGEYTNTYTYNKSTLRSAMMSGNYINAGFLRTRGHANNDKQLEYWFWTGRILSGSSGSSISRNGNTLSGSALQNTISNYSYYGDKQSGGTVNAIQYTYNATLTPMSLLVFFEKSGSKQSFQHSISEAVNGKLMANGTPYVSAPQYMMGVANANGSEVTYFPFYKMPDMDDSQRENIYNSITAVADAVFVASNIKGQQTRQINIATEPIITTNYNFQLTNIIIKASIGAPYYRRSDGTTVNLYTSAGTILNWLRSYQETNAETNTLLDTNLFTYSSTITGATINLEEQVTSDTIITFNTESDFNAFLIAVQSAVDAKRSERNTAITVNENNPIAQYENRTVILHEYMFTDPDSAFAKQLDDFIGFLTASGTNASSIRAKQYAGSNRTVRIEAHGGNNNRRLDIGRNAEGDGFYFPNITATYG